MGSTENLLGSDLQVDTVIQQHLTDSAKWARFLAIVGFIFSALIFLVGLFGLFSADTSPRRRSYFETTSSRDFSPIFSAAIVIVISLVWFATSLYTFRFADKMKTALANSDQYSLNDSFANLAKNYRLMGIVTIVYLVLVLLAIFAGVAFSATK